MCSASNRKKRDAATNYIINSIKNGSKRSEPKFLMHYSTLVKIHRKWKILPDTTNI